ncbi:hypothetical protein MsAg5_09570 [Methanosarcinaceae archaeon Ag5]|uniref:DUF7847 domain-containing protein n=1 Tax=Methanolapillus africanus TaxID=3028297 RepID=A0AAE4SDZ1_9EURY|nr:hypothetical protein [Methanosarcinaceae archaeon Ag5]
MESISDIITNGYHTLKKNQSLVAPLLIFFVVYFIFNAIFQVISMFLGIGVSFTGSYSAVMVLMTIIWIISLVVTLLLTAYFEAGAIGLARDATATGKVKWSDMWTYGKQYYVRLFLAQIVLAVISLVCILFFIPFIYEAVKYSGFYDPLGTHSTAMIAYLMLGLLLTLVYSIVISLIFYFVSYAIVIDNLSVTDSFKKSYKLFREYPGKIISFFLALIAIIILIAIVFVVGFVILALFFISPILAIIGILLMLVLYLIFIVVLILFAVLATIWETRLYMVLTGKPIFGTETELHRDTSQQHLAEMRAEEEKETATVPKTDAESQTETQTQIKTDDEEESELNN